MLATLSIADEVIDERARQDERWGEQNHPNGTGGFYYRSEMKHFRAQNELAVSTGDLTWALILLEEVYEALAERETDRLREELVQVAAVAQAWIEAIDRRSR